MNHRFEQTMTEIKAAYAPTSNAKRIYYEYNSDYRRVVVLECGRGFEIITYYKGIAKEFNKTLSTCWGCKSDAIAWAKYYSDNRNIICGSLTIIEKKGVQLI